MDHQRVFARIGHRKHQFEFLPLQNREIVPHRIFGLDGGRLHPLAAGGNEHGCEEQHGVCQTAFSHNYGIK